MLNNQDNRPHHHYQQGYSQYPQQGYSQYPQQMPVQTVPVQMVPVQTMPMQQFSAPAPVMMQGGFQQRMPPPPRYSHGSGYDYDNGDSSSLKKAVILSGVTSGKLNPVTAVAMDRNNGMSATDTAIASSLGNGFATVAAMGGLDSHSSSSSGGGMFGGNNLLSTMVVANALSPSSSSNSKDNNNNNNNAFGSLATIALLSNMDNNNQQQRYNGGY